MVFGYLLGFVSSILLVIFILLAIFKFTVFNQEYVLNILDINNYYENIYKDIKKDFSNSLRSSGVDDMVLDGIYSSSGTERDIKNYIASMYSGSKYEVNSSEIKEKLNNNIDKYLKDNNLEANKNSLNKYIDGVVSIYENQIELYGYLDGGIQKFVKFGKFIDLFIAVILILFVITFAVLRYVLHRRYSGVIALSSGLMIIYLKLFIYNLIDFKNIVIISDDFSKFVNVLFTEIGNYLLLGASACIIISVFLNIKSSMMKIKRIKKV